jgi:hypothetical protein
MESGAPLIGLDGNGNAFTTFVPRGDLVPCHTVHINTAERNTSVNPSAHSIQCRFSRQYRQVYAMEIVEAIVPLNSNTSPFLFITCKTGSDSVDFYEAAPPLQPSATANKLPGGALCKICAIDPKGGYVKYDANNQNPSRKVFPQLLASLQEVSFEFKVDDNTYWDLSGVNASFTLRIYCAN